MDIVDKGPCIPKSTINTITKPSEDWAENNKKLWSLNVKAMNILYCGLNALILIEYPCVKMQKQWTLKSFMKVHIKLKNKK